MIFSTRSGHASGTLELVIRKSHELLIEVCDKVGGSVSQDVWLIAKGAPKKKWRSEVTVRYLPS
jgi:hypothetical protein